MTITIYCDESGYTGNNLWQDDQPYFVYSGVAIDEREAMQIVEKCRKDFRIDSTELHAFKLLKRNRGRDALKWLLPQLAPRSSIVVMHKRYCLAAKMFEYLIGKRT